MRGVLLRVFGFWGALLWPALAWAQLGEHDSPIQTNAYSVDLYQGPVLASTRVIGLAGAYVAVAEFVEGNTQNPAAPAVRSDYSFDHLDYDIGVGVTFPGTITGTDFFNSGKGQTSLSDTTQGGFVFLELSGNLQFGPWGIGAASSIQQYGLESSKGSTDTLRTQISVTNLQLARAFDRGQIVLGLGARLGSMNIFNTNTETASSGSIFQSIAITPEFGVLYRPNGKNYRFGASFRGPLDAGVGNTATDSNVLYPGTDQVLYLPERVSTPWELALGAAYRFGRTFNPEWLDPSSHTQDLRERLNWSKQQRETRRQEFLAELRGTRPEMRAQLQAFDAAQADETARDEAELARTEREIRKRLKTRYAELNRHYLLVSAALFVNGTVADAVGIESFFERRVHRSGEFTTVSPRLGLESEIIPYWVILRAGTYLEPTRFTENPAGARLHGTFGADFRLGQWNVFGAWPDTYVWRLRTSADVSRNYFNWGLAIGGFY